MDDDDFTDRDIVWMHDPENSDGPPGGVSLSQLAAAMHQEEAWKQLKDHANGRSRLRARSVSPNTSRKRAKR